MPLPRKSTRQADSALLGEIDLDRELYEQDGVVNGTLRFVRPVTSPTQVEWTDSFGRVAARVTLPASGPATVALPFSFNLTFGLTYVNWVRVKVNGVARQPAPNFCSRRGGPRGTIITTSCGPIIGTGSTVCSAKPGSTPRSRRAITDYSPILNNNFDFYVEQMAWEVFSIYHKDQSLWRGLIAKLGN